MSKPPFADWLTVLSLIKQSHEAVRKADWDTFLQLEDQYFASLETTQDQPVDIASLDAEHRHAFSELVQEIIALHQHTALLAEVHRSELANEIALTSTQGKLVKVYR